MSGQRSPDPGRALLVCVALLAPAGCGRPLPGEVTSGRMPVLGGTIRLVQSPPTSLDPATLTTVYDAAVTNQLFDGLAAWDEHLRPVPALARDWVVSRDGLLYRFTLHRGVRFHDGSPLEVEDIVFTLERLLRLGRGRVSRTLAILRHIEGAAAFERGERAHLSGIKLLGPDRFEIRLQEREPAFLQALASDTVKIVPRHAVESAGERFGREPVGTGPFRLDAWNDGESLELAAFSGHFRGRPRVDRLVLRLRPYPSPGAELAALEAGELHALQLAVGQLPPAGSRRHLRLVRRTEPNLFYLGFNLTQPPFDRRELRRAFAAALDPRRLARALSHDLIPAEGIVPKGIPGYHSRPARPRARARAARFPGDGDELGLDPAHPCLTILAASPGADHAAMLEQLTAAGIPAEITYVSWEELDRATDDGTAGAFLLGLVVDLPDARSFLFDTFHSDGGDNYFAYSNPEVDRLLEAAGSEVDPQRRLDALQRAERLVLEDAPIVPLYHRPNTVAILSRLQGFEMNPFGLADVAWEKAWLEGR